MTTFVYQPKSGDRVFAENFNGIHCIRWGNGSRHIVNGIQLVYPAASQGSYWRAQAKRMAGQLVALYGGCAEDAQGTIALVVPVDSAPEVDHMMQAACRAANGSIPADDNRRNVAAMVLGGWDIDLDYIDGSPVYLCGPFRVREERNIFPNTDGKIVVEAQGFANGDNVEWFPVATVPLSWGMPVEVSCGWEPHEYPSVPEYASYPMVAM